MSSRRFSSTRIKLSDLSDEDCRKWMDSVEIDSEDQYNDDDTNDPDFNLDEITPELDDAIDECLQFQTTTDMFDAANIHNISLHISSSENSLLIYF